MSSTRNSVFGNLKNSIVQKDKETINDISFNQDKTCMAFATNLGYFIVKVESLQKICHRNIGSISKIRMLFSSNLLGLVGTNEDNSIKTPNYFVMQDDKNFKFLGELDCKKTIQDVRIKKDIVFCKTDLNITIFNFRTDETIKVIELMKKQSVFACAIDKSVPLLCYSGDKIGEVRLYDYSAKFTQKIPAHKNEIRILQMDYSGKVIITCSETGTLIRVFCTKTYIQLAEFRYGQKDCTMKDISINMKCDLIIACNSSKNIRMFTFVGQDDDTSSRNSVVIENERRKTKNFFEKMKIFKKNKEISEWKFKADNTASFKRVNFDQNGRSVVALTDKGIVYRLDLTDNIQNNAKMIDKNDLLNANVMKDFGT